ncbi:MAG TPA: GyrI-like domain-containing protein [Bacteroidota bacterium]
MEKIDLKRTLKHLYAPSTREMAFVDVPAMNFLMVDGRGDPNGSREYSEAAEALYSTAYTLKFMVKQGQAGIDYGVMPLEGLWWSDDPNDFLAGNKGNWQWTAMIMQPEYVTAELFDDGLATVSARKTLPALSRLRFERFAEGHAAQVMHVGPYAAEGPTIQRLHGFIAEGGHELSGKHHEIYISDPGRTKPEKLLTVIRQPARPEARGEPAGEGLHTPSSRAPRVSS